MLFFNFGMSWIVSFLGFPAGCFVCTKYEAFKDKMLAKKVVCVLFIITLLSFAGVFLSSNVCLGNVLRSIFCLCFIYWLMVVLTRVELCNNGLSAFLTAISLEIYLSQGFGNSFVISHHFNLYMAVLISLLIVSLLSVATHPFVRKLKALLYGNRNK